MSATMKAYQATDGDDGWAIVFAANGAAARRYAADEIGCDFAEIESCRRAQSLDQFYERPIPIGAILDIGWWLSCSGCEKRISDDGDIDVGDECLAWFGELVCDDAEHIVTDVPVGTFSKPYCSERCRAWHARETTATKTCEAAAIADLSAAVIARFPDAKIINTHAYASRTSGEMCASQVIVNFSFPGAKWGGAGVRFEPRKSPELQWSVSNGDRQAYAAYVAQHHANATAAP